MLMKSRIALVLISRNWQRKLPIKSLAIPILEPYCVIYFYTERMGSTNRNYGRHFVLSTLFKKKTLLKAGTEFHIDDKGSYNYN
jgi:hypothetical protein